MSEPTKKKSLSSFMLKEGVANIEVKLDRFDEPFVLRPMRTSDAKLARLKHTKKGQELDAMAFGAELLITTCITPDFDNAELQDFYDAQGAQDLVDKMLTFGEFQAISEAINNDIQSVNEDIEEAKN